MDDGKVESFLAFRDHGVGDELIENIGHKTRALTAA